MNTYHVLLGTSVPVISALVELLTITFFSRGVDFQARAVLTTLLLIDQNNGIAVGLLDAQFERPDLLLLRLVSLFLGRDLNQRGVLQAGFFVL